jgi:carboxyl-terminal processing protease
LDFIKKRLKIIELMFVENTENTDSDNGEEKKKNHNSAFQNRKNNKNQFTVWIPLMMAFMLAIGLLVGLMLGKSGRSIIRMTDANGNLVELTRVEEVLQYIDAKYLEGINPLTLEDAAIQGMLKKLDPHSSFIPREKIRGVKESLQGNFDGIGVEFYMLDDTILVVGVIPDGPSAQAGVKLGDRIVRVNDSLLAGVGLKNTDVINRLKGKAGTVANVEIRRRGEKKPLKLKIIRGQVPMASVDASFMLNEKTGYIRISRFSGQTFKEFMKAFEDLTKNKGMKDLVIDLRSNPGGYLNEATDILNQLFDDKRLLVYTEGRSYKRKEYKSNGRAYFRIGKIAVLINESSASASEILAGAIQDNDRGIVIGRRSFGKGLVQEQYDLSDSSALRLTVARYYTPSGRLIQRPYREGESDEYDEDFDYRFQSGELLYRDSIKITDSTAYKTTGGRLVYGGGGIIPDIFVPIDTILYNDYFQSLSQFAPAFIYRHMDANFYALDNYKSAIEFADSYIVSTKMFDEFIEYAIRKGKLTKNEKLIQLSKSQLSLSLKAQIAQQLFRIEGYYICMSKKDKDILKALEELKRSK